METTRSTELEGGIVNTNSPSPYRRRTSSAVLALKKELLLKAAKEKARIQMDLVEKQLAADIAAVNAKYSPLTLKFNSKYCHDVKKRNERSQQELEGHKASETGITYGSVFPPPDSDGTACPVQQLDSALNGMHTTSTSTSRNDDIRSRISAPMEAPELAAERTEWLLRYTAAEKNMCNFNHNQKASELTSTTTTETVMSTPRGNYNQSKLVHVSARQSNIPNILVPRPRECKFSSYLDGHIVPRTDSRLYADAHVLPTMKKHVVLDGQGYARKVIASYYQNKADHRNYEMMASELKPKQWIICLCPTVINVLKHMEFAIDPGGIRKIWPSGPSPDGVPGALGAMVECYEDIVLRGPHASLSLP